MASTASTVRLHALFRDLHNRAGVVTNSLFIAGFGLTDRSDRVPGAWSMRPLKGRRGVPALSAQWTSDGLGPISVGPCSDRIFGSGALQC